MSSKNKAYAEQYAEYAMGQMRRYGIPASVILAQGMLESSNGQSELARKENNHFGIKATPKWLDEGGRYGVYTDDRPNEKFCSYDNAGESYEHHSQFLAENKRYSACFALSADDYKGWAKGLEKAGYATGSGYSASLIRIIEQNGLDRYDRIVMEDMRAKGLVPGETRGPETEGKHYSFPLKREAYLWVTSPFGMRPDPADASRQEMHKGIDIRADREAVLATEDDGKIVAVEQDIHKPGGKSVTVEYKREDQSSYRVSYSHLDSVQVKTGDTVQAGQQLGISGNTGTRATGLHLHFSVVQVNSDGSKRDIDPAAYLAEISEKGNIRQQALHNGQDLLTKYKVSDSSGMPTNLTPEEWMKKLLSSEDSGIGLGTGADPVVEMAVTLFTSLMALAIQIDNREEQRQQATEAALDKHIDLTSLFPSFKACVFEIREGEKPILHIDDGEERYSHELTASEMNRLSLLLSKDELSSGEKHARLVSLVNGIVIQGQMSRNYEQELEQQDNRENLQIK